MKKLVAVMAVGIALTACKTKTVTNQDGSTTTTSVASYEPSRTVLKRFYKDFPLAKKLHWTHNETRAFVDFISKEGYKSSATYGLDGTLLENNAGFDINKLPVNVKNYLNTKYPGNEVVSAYYVRTGLTRKNILVELKNTQDVLFDLAGNFVSYK